MFKKILLLTKGLGLCVELILAANYVPSHAKWQQLMCLLVLSVLLITLMRVAPVPAPRRRSRMMTRRQYMRYLLVEMTP